MPLDGGYSANLGRATEQLTNDLLKRGERFRADRSNFDALWQKIRDKILPTLQAIIAKETPGTQSHLKVLDSTPEQALELLAAALYAGLTQPGLPWLNLRALDERLNRIPAVALWLEEASRKLLSIFGSPTGNFETAQHEKYIELVGFGSGCMFIEDRPGGTMSFQTRPMAECYFAEDRDGRVDTVFRWHKRTARQAVQEFGKNAGAKIVRAFEDPAHSDDEFEFLHATYPRGDRDPAKAWDPRNMRWASCWLNVDEKHLARESGYPEFPYSCPRFQKRAGEVYGRGPGGKMLPDSEMLNRAMKVTIRGVEKKVDPPLIVAHDGVISPVRVTPSGINYVEPDLLRGGLSPIMALDTGANPGLGADFMKDLRERIQFAAYTHLIQFARDPNMTATQFLGISEQTARVLAPIIARLQAEDLNPMIQRAFPIALRNGDLGMPPPELAGQPLVVEYVSPLTQQRRISEARAYAQTIATLAPVAQTHPEIMDNFDHDTASRDVADILGMSKRWIRTTEQVASIRQARQQAIAEKSQIEDNQAKADTIHTLASSAEVARKALTPASSTAGSA